MLAMAMAMAMAMADGDESPQRINASTFDLRPSPFPLTYTSCIPGICLSRHGNVFRRGNEDGREEHRDGWCR